MRMARIDIGLRQAHKLANMPPDRRTAFNAEGLPILLESARSLYAASQVYRTCRVNPAC